MRTLIVDDSAVIRSILKSILEEAADFEIVGEATNGETAVSMVRDLQPDLVLMDINMPIMNGLEATRIIMKETPVPVCIFSNEVDSDMTVRALGLGALDAVRKPDFDTINDQSFLSDFLARLRGMGKARFGASRKPGPVKAAAAHTTYQALVVGASTGGPAALKDLLGGIPADFPPGIALVQHIEERFDRSFAEWLDTQTPLKVRLAATGDRFIPGTVLVAPGGKHLICREGKLYPDDGPKVLNQKPAVDRLFQTAGSWFREGTAAVLLTGMGTDGADGCLHIKQSGGHTIVQDEESSAIFGMPKAAIDKNGASIVLPLSKMSDYLVRLTEKNKGRIHG